MSKIRTKRRLITITLTLLVIVIVSLIFTFKYSFEHWLEPVSNNQEIIKSNLGDTFTVRYVTRNFPDLSTDVTIMDSRKEEIAYYVIDGEFYKSNLLTIIDSSRIRCYEFYGLLIYKFANGSFKSIYINRISELKIEKQSEFVEVARALASKKEWKWIKACGSFLLKAGDEDMRKMLERYASGQFSQEELNVNKNSEFKKEEMQTFSKQILEQTTRIDVDKGKDKGNPLN